MSRPKQTKGFTLIELVIVLAIAALILAAVLLAVGGAQRSQRDNSRKNLAGRTTTALQNYLSNNNGVFPSAGLAVGGNYLSGITDIDTNAVPANVAVGGTTTAIQGIKYTTQGKCTAGTPKVAPTVAATARDYAVVYWSEASGTALCIDNQ